MGSNLVLSKILDGNGVKSKPGSIPAPNPGSFENEKNTGSQMGHTKNMLKRKTGMIEIEVTHTETEITFLVFLKLITSFIGLTPERNKLEKK